ncbi:sulfatase-like hydrolase/transferase [Thalassotalea sp. PS06]|uniref:sulfatase-like hydrolase/transferase n=1 Tax=Thalassotalea sp. PS06 TaxID=2594005 RepID=UPI001164E07D|nr:sulfatase-like hydrolase/transferase [Thalassotalea sp. PS06]QDP02075.1 sulfatase-like hydrolase/transferase [Thalassotalea sp. PS06]
MSNVNPLKSNKSGTVSGLLVIVICTFVFLFLEWIFFLTKPSFLSYIDNFQKVAILLNSFLILTIINVLLYLLIQLLMKTAGLLLKLPELLNRVAIRLIPLLLCSVSVLLIIDNNTYTLFSFASYTVQDSLHRLLYLGLIIILCGYFYLKTGNMMDYLNANLKVRKSLLFSLIPIFILSLITFTQNFTSNASTSLPVPVSQHRGERPNIIIFSADGVNAKQMSLYGYNKETTPFFDSIRDELAIYDNHFTNSAKTTGSVGALLTGKLPTQTKVIFRPDAFKGLDRYQHMPAILSKLGYYNIDISVRHYIDAEDLNLYNSFDFANERPIFSRHGLSLWMYRHQEETSKFIDSIWERLIYRALHLSFLNDWKNPFVLVTQTEGLEEHLSDIPRMQALINSIKNAPQPYFIHVHLLGPHGSRFFYEKPIFTASNKQPHEWMEEHYNNAIYQWDSYAKAVYQQLSRLDQLESTMLIFNSDHGWQHTINNDLPLMIRYPRGSHAGSESLPSQRIDIAPTILDYLNIDKPTWMTGQSLLAEGREHVPIYMVGSSITRKINNYNWKVSASLEPPYFSLGTLSVFYCGKILTLNLMSQSPEHQIFEQLHQPDYQCPEQDLSRSDIELMLREHLRRYYPPS